MDKTILLLGTGDTKSDEMQFLADCIKAQGGSVLVMDVGVIGDPTCQVDISRHDVAKAAKTDNAAIIALGDENKAMVKTSQGAATLARELCDEGRVHGVLILGGTMGTDLALDVCEALPLGFPKVILTTVAFSPLLPPDRISPDVMMVLWAGRPLRAEHRLPHVTVAGRGCGSGCGARLDRREGQETDDRHDVPWQFIVEIHEAPETRP